MFNFGSLFKLAGRNLRCMSNTRRAEGQGKGGGGGREEGGVGVGSSQYKCLIHKLS